MSNKNVVLKDAQGNILKVTENSLKKSYIKILSEEIAAPAGDYTVSGLYSLLADYFGTPTKVSGYISLSYELPLPDSGYVCYSDMLTYITMYHNINIKTGAQIYGLYAKPLGEDYYFSGSWNSKEVDLSKITTSILFSQETLHYDSQAISLISDEINEDCTWTVEDLYKLVVNSNSYTNTAYIKVANTAISTDSAYDAVAIDDNNIFSITINKSEVIKNEWNSDSNEYEDVLYNRYNFIIKQKDILPSQATYYFTGNIDIKDGEGRLAKELFAAEYIHHYNVQEPGLELLDLRNIIQVPKKLL